MQRLEIVNYTTSLFHALLAATLELPDDSTLRHKGFVDHYYASSKNCGLFLAIDGDGKVRGTLGVERMPFLVEGTVRVFGFGSNFNALQPGAGAYLFFHWLRNCDAGIALGGSQDTHKMLTRIGWAYHAGVKTFILNRTYEEAGKTGFVQGLARSTLRLLSQRHPLAALTRRLPNDRNQEVSTVERNSFDELSLDFKSAFPFRFAPDRAYLSWRYSPDLPFVKYRLFQMVHRDAPAGFVVLQERRNQVIVSHSDGADPQLLATGIVQSLAAVASGPGDRREVRVISSHPGMQEILQAAGFRHRQRWDRPLAFGTLRGKLDVPCPTSQWLVNYDWGDNGLRTPFLDQLPAA